MSEVSRAAKVGLMTVALAGALYGGTRFISRDTGTRGGYRVHAFMPDVTGIAPRSRVMISGIQVGYIDDLTLAKDKPGMARVDVRMRPEFPLYLDATIAKHATSLIGESIIVLTPGADKDHQIPNEGEVTHVLVEADLPAIEQQISEVLKDVKAVTGTLKNTVGSDRGQANIDRILKNLADATEQLNEAVKENRAGVKGVVDNVNAITGDARPQLAEILSNIKQVTDDVRKMTAAAGPPGAGPGPGGAGKPPGELRSTIERVNRASASLESTLAHADAVAARLDKGEGTLGRLTKDETLINEVEGVVEDVGDLVGGFGRMQTVVGLRADYNFLANTIKSYVELRLQPQEDKYYVIELVNDPRGKTSVEQVDVDTTNPNQPAHYRETRTTTANAFRLSFQFAKRIGPLTGRFGIKESTGGIGLDLHLLNDRFELRQDLFGFGEQLSPRWRVIVAYEFIRKLWLLGGVDDILNGARRDYFVGLQLRFTDNDLKSILPFASGAVPH